MVNKKRFSETWAMCIRIPLKANGDKTENYKDHIIFSNV